jgi:dTDP-4-dehydrorhamnose 3,5-epimerase
MGGETLPMQVVATKIEAVKIITQRRFYDDRGFFEEIFNSQRFKEHGLECDFVQDNHSYSREVGAIRGLHFQTPPFAQDKLVGCPRGALLDVAVDLRSGSATYGQYVCEELTPENGRQLFVPIGFAHGFCTLKPDTEITYKVSNYYAPDHDAGIAWNDSDLAIKWPVSSGDAKLSEKDQRLPFLKNAPEAFPIV